jgi:anti-sigma B factor antagonist
MIESRRVGPATVVRVQGRLTAEIGLRQAMRAAFDEGSPAVIFNLGEVTGVDSSGLAELLSCESIASSRGSRLVICSPSSKANAVILVAQLHHVLNVYMTEEQALASIKPS